MTREPQTEEKAKGYDLGTWDRTVRQKCERLGLPGPGMTDLDRGSSEWRVLQAQLRVWEAEREQRNARVWLIALASAVASILSAMAAWVAVLR
jgi:hypothetical protein